MPVQRAAVFPLVIFGGVLAWWGWKSGGYFEVTFLPGTMVLLALVALLLLFAPGLVELRGPALVSLAALGALAAWTLISGIWSAVPAVAFSDAQRAVGYVAAFVIGAWSCVLLGRRVLLSLGPLAIAGALVGFVTLLVLWTGSNSRDFFETDATLRYPIGYRNAEAAFFLMALLPAIVLCASRELSWPVRGVLLGSSTLMIELAILAQSRASVFALVIAVAVLIIAHPDGLRVLGWLALAAIPAAIALPWLLDVFQRDAATPRPRSRRFTRPASRWRSRRGERRGRVPRCAAGAGFSLPDRARTGIGRGLLAGSGSSCSSGWSRCSAATADRAASSTGASTSSRPGRPTCRARAAASGSTSARIAASSGGSPSTTSTGTRSAARGRAAFAPATCSTAKPAYSRRIRTASRC